MDGDLGEPATTNRIREDLRELKSRTGVIERHIASVVAIGANHYAALADRLDHLTDRVDRIEEYLELRDA